MPCDPAACADLATGVPADTVAAWGYAECVRRAGDVRAMVCACTRELWACLVDDAGGACRAVTPDQPVDEAGPWCRKLVARRRLGCSADLCGAAPPPAAFEEHEEFPVTYTAVLVAASAVLLLLSVRGLLRGTPAGRQAMGQQRYAARPPPPRGVGSSKRKAA